MYEITFIAKDEKNQIIKTLLASLKAKIISEEILGRKKFAYKIHGETAGFYTTILFELDPQKIAQLNKKMQLEKEILRYILIKKEAKKEILPKKIPQAIRAETDVQEEIIREAPRLKTKEESASRGSALSGKEKKPAKVKVEKIRLPKTVIKPPETAKKEQVLSDEERLKKLEEKLGELLKE